MTSPPVLEIRPGAFARADGTLFLAASKSLLVADAHFGYEEVIGGILPLLSLPEMLQTLERALAQTQARELIFLGDSIHGARLSVGAGTQIMALFARLREITTVVCVAGNHEGRSRGRAILGDTVEEMERAGWLLVHGDDHAPVRTPAGRRRPVIIGHFHPSLHLGAGKSAQVFVHAPQAIIVPALTPYSPGLDVRSADAHSALRPWFHRAGNASVVAITPTTIRHLGTIDQLREVRFSLAPKVARPLARGLIKRKG